MVLTAAALGLLIGLAVGTLGGGGSVLAVPALVYLLDQPVEQATTTSLLVVAAGAVTGGLGSARAGRVCWRHAGTFTAAAIPGIAAGTLAGNVASGPVLLGAFAVLMLVAARATWRRSDAADEEDGAWKRGAACPPLRLPRDVLAGTGVGFVTGLLGVGGGFLIVPTLAVALAFSLRTAVGTSLAIITGTSLLGLAAHLLAGRQLDADIAPVMTVTCVAGALLGVALGGRLPQRTLGRAFAVLVVGVAGYLLASLAVMGGPPAA